MRTFHGMTIHVIPKMSETSSAETLNFFQVGYIVHLELYTSQIFAQSFRSTEILEKASTPTQVSFSRAQKRFWGKRETDDGPTYPSIPGLKISISTTYAFRWPANPQPWARWLTSSYQYITFHDHTPSSYSSAHHNSIFNRIILLVHLPPPPIFLNIRQKGS
jgi:hypothetical protein